MVNMIHFLYGNACMTTELENTHLFGDDGPMVFSCHFMFQTKVIPLDEPESGSECERMTKNVEEFLFLFQFPFIVCI